MWPDGQERLELVEHTKTLLKSRGPDVSHEHRIDCDDFEFCGFVLWQQGVKVTIQPLVNENQVLLFNGDIYSTSLEQKSLQQSDTDWLFCKILECDEESELMALLEQIQGPYSLIYYNHSTKRFYFARDSLGRQSLLIGSTTESGGRKVNKNKALTRSKSRFNPIEQSFKPCRICRSKVHQVGSHYCQACSYKKGICTMCGKKLLDTKSYRQSAA